MPDADHTLLIPYGMGCPKHKNCFECTLPECTFKSDGAKIAHTVYRETPAGLVRLGKADTQWRT